MRILVLNSILHTSQNNIIPRRDSIRDCMIYNFCLGFNKLGHQVTLIAAEDYKPTKRESYPFSVIFQETQLKNIFSPSVLPLQKSLFSFLLKKHRQFDLVITSELFSIPSFFAVLLCRKKVIVWQELNCHNKKLRKIPSLFWYNIMGRFFFGNVCIAPRSQSAHSFVQKYCSNVSPTIIDHGVNLENFPVCLKKEKQFIVVAQLIKRKQVDYIIMQFSNFIESDSPKYKDYKLKIAGVGVEEESLKKMVTMLGLQDKVCFLGLLPHKDLSLELSMSIASLIATNKDLNMVSIPESIVCGTPILTNSVPALSSYIRQNELGITSDNWTEKELIQMIERIEEFSSNCLTHRPELSIEKSAEKFIKLYHSLSII